MNLLLDTHVFLWWSVTPHRLSATALAACQDDSNSLFLSVLSAWEIQIKLQIRKLVIPSPLEHLIQHQQQTNSMQMLPMLLPHVYTLASLPMHHKDPFDRLLVAQAVAENLTIVSNDALLSLYPVPLLW
jgi:PIN domain nuclease of toxin-antitoxin system